MRPTVADLYNILTEVCGISEEFINGAIAVGGFTKETMNTVAYYESGYQSVEDWANAIAEELEEEE